MLTNNQINQIAEMLIESGNLNDDISEHIGLILENIAGIELLDDDQLNSLHSKIEQAVNELKEALKKIKDSGKVRTNKKTTLLAFKPGFIDSFKKIKRAPQIIPLKDVGSIITETGINKTSVVVDAGSGSGALAVILGSIAKKVVSYELREDFAKVASENVKFLKLKNLVILIRII